LSFLLEIVLIFSEVNPFSYMFQEHSIGGLQEERCSLNETRLYIWLIIMRKRSFVAIVELHQVKLSAVPYWEAENPSSQTSGNKQNQGYLL